MAQNQLYLGNTLLLDLSGYALTENVYTKAEVDSAIENVDVTAQLANYVEKEDGKGLSTNDFTDALLEKLNGLENFDPTDINGAISALQNALGDITGDGKEVTAALDTWAEIKKFVEDYGSSDSLATLLSTAEANIIAAIEGKGYITADAISGKLDASVYEGKVAEIEGEISGVKGRIETLEAIDHSQFATKDELHEAYDDTEVRGLIATAQAKADAADGKANSLNTRVEALENKPEVDTTGFVTKDELNQTEQALSQAVATVQQNKVENLGGISGIMKITKADYDALEEKNEAVLYIVLG